jgi:hypothetical protein
LFDYFDLHCAKTGYLYPIGFPGANIYSPTPSSLHGIILPVEITMERYLELMRTLPPLVAGVVWDVVNGRITQATVDLAKATSREEFDRYDIVRCVAAANPNYPPLELAIELIHELVETMIVER